MTNKTTGKPAGGSRLLKVVNIPAQSRQPAANVQSEPANQYATDEIGPGKQVSLNFSLALAAEPETLIDSNFGKNPVNFSIGDGNLLPGFERLMYGLKAGDESSFSVPAGDAFGERNEDNIQSYPRYQFPADLVMEAGLMISFADAAGNEQAGIVYRVHPDTVEIDFNHPLAGRDILFSVAIAAVRPDLS